MSTIKSSAENLTLNADGANNDIIFQSNGSNVATLDQAGLLTATTFAGSGASLTALPAAQVSGTHTSFTSTGIDDNADATAITINASENVGIGVTPETWETGWTGLQVGGLGAIVCTTSGNAGGNAWITNNMYINGAGQLSYIVTDEASRHRQVNGVHYFDVAASGTADAAISFTTAMTIDVEGSTTWGTWGYSNNSVYINVGGKRAIYMGVDTTASTNRIKFANSNGYVGGISTSGSATAFNTSSDYRLKENVDYTWDATTRLKQLKPARFNFIADDTKTVDGFLAHEVSSIVPEAISGEKDAMTTEVLYVEGDELPEGKSTGDVKEASVIDPQGIDQSKLVPLLVKTIQELEARITALEA